MSVSNVARLLTFMFAGMAHLGCSPPEHRTAAVRRGPPPSATPRLTDSAARALLLPVYAQGKPS